MILFFDTETTGKADFRAPADAEHQPRLVQLGAILTDDAGLEVASANFTVQPEGFEIPRQASSVHGITTELAVNRGITLESVLHVFAGFCQKSHIVVAHNLQFDRYVMNGEFLRARFEDIPFADEQVKFCTMEAMTDICQLPGPYGFKWPKLIEAYRFAFKEEFIGAHDAMADVRACARIYFWLRDTKPEAGK